MTDINSQYIMAIAWIIGLIIAILIWVFLWFFLSGVIRRGIDQSIIQEQTDDIEEYHKNMLAIESQKVALLRVQNQMIQEQLARQQPDSIPDSATVTFPPQPK